MNQELIFTTLPHLRFEKNGKSYLKLSVYVSPHLKSSTDTTLVNAPDMFHWAEVIKNTDFAFRITGQSNEIPATLDKAQIDATLYEEIFHKDIKIEKHKSEELHLKPIQSFPVKHIQNFLLEQVKISAVKSPTQMLPITDFIAPDRLGALSNINIAPNAANEAEDESRTRPMMVKSIIKKNDTAINDVRNTLKTNRFIAFKPQMKPREDFIQLVDFHRPEISKNFQKLDIRKPEFEFHNILSVLSSFPELMRKLGFVLDFEIPYDSSIPQKGAIRVVPLNLDFKEKETKLSAPLTAYQITPTGFFAADKKNSALKNGFVKINTPEFSVVQMDTDGMALKTVRAVEEKTNAIADYIHRKSISRVEISRAIRNFEVAGLNKVSQIAVNPNIKASKKVTGVQTSVASQLKTNFSTYQKMRIIANLNIVKPPAKGGFGTTRSAGIALVRNGMSQILSEKMTRNFQFQKSLMDNAKTDRTLKVLRLPEEVLYSDDLVMAYRMDITYEENPKTWYSLHRRQMSYSWFDKKGNEHPIDKVEADEGYVELGIVEKEGVSDRLFVPETLARWEGWSLSVGRPGLAINDSEEHPDPNPTKRNDFLHSTRALEMKKYRFDPTLDFKVNAQSDLVPGTLPKLRFGKSYRVRVRTVDMAGNSQPLESESDSPAETYCPSIKYMRYEPLSSPITLVGNELRDGESLEQMVIRSNYNAEVKKYERDNKVKGQNSEGLSVRYLLPPKNSQLMAETHGCFEKAFTNQQYAKEIYKIITSLEGLYQSAPDNKEKIYSESEAKIIYLPDPMAAGIAIFADSECDETHSQNFEPRMFSYFSKDEIMPNGTNNVSIPEDWYNTSAIILKLEEGSKLDGEWNGKKRTFTIHLPKAQRLRLKISTFWREEDLKNLSAIWHMVQQGAGSDLKSIEKTALGGQHWMISPSRTFELVHAVQQPLEAPSIKGVISERAYDDTTAQIHTRFHINGESTESVEFQAQWTELHDDGISVEIKRKEFRDSISEIDIFYHDKTITIGNVPDYRPELSLNNTRVHTGLWKTQPQQLQKFDVQPNSPVISNMYKINASKLATVESQISAKNLSLIEKLKANITEYSLGLVKLLDVRNFPLEHAFGNTRHRWVNYSVIASSRYSEYFNAIKKQKPDIPFTRESEAHKVNILSTARPVKPEVDYVIPAFEWVKTSQNDVMKHVRKGGVLRVFLKRPWFSSGDDEKLAVILTDDNRSRPSTSARHSSGYTDYYTHWGSDPLFITDGPKNYGPRPEDFRHDPVIDKGLVYPDYKGMTATAVAYPVVFDREKQMWYADIAINTANMYFPFIKLALARYQEHSLRIDQTDVCLSPVVMSTMIQMVPERIASIELKPKARNMTFRFKLSGPTYSQHDSGSSAKVRISFIDVGDNLPIQGVMINKSMEIFKDKTNEWEFSLGRHMKGNNYFEINEEIEIPEKYKSRPFDVIIEEVETPMLRIQGIDAKYEERLRNLEETERVVYVDVFRIGK